ncbi:hypothetical protein R5W23_003011 [Gemmata sp. JC673]|uniref:Uncharacterized protein n=1 Tax=Gemmata algarum TaxID=2975278 RepID=A0ABU5ERP0_9BACT|nr:hypothetical protein [Gemmata algarum]MDY3557746.1 hypothetical protein [Gemmata algarum]
MNSFTSTYQSLISVHTIDDEPSLSGSGTGTESFHRDEAFTEGNDVTGSGSYVGGSGNANYHAVETTSFETDDQLTVSGDYSTGYNAAGEAYDLVFNYSLDLSGSGSTSVTHDYHDGGTGPALSGEIFTASASSQADSSWWGSLDGQSF